MNIITEQIPDIVDGWFSNIEMIWDNENSECYLKIVKLCPDHNIEIICCDNYFANCVELSAFLSSEITTYEARKLLYQNNIPKESLLWSLNHDGCVDMSKE